MTDVQKILLAMATGYHDGQIGEEDCEGIAKALNGVPEAYHMDALKSFLSIQEDQPEEQSEDYLQVKTYTSDKISVGDEISVCSGLRGVYVGRSCASGYCLLVDHGKIYDYADISAWTRTGRNFPAIPAILEELKKLDKPGRE